MFAPKDFQFTNKYLTAYLALCAKRLLDPYTARPREKHHIYPRALFGENAQVVSLSLREHFVAHRLLHKAYLKAFGLSDRRTVHMTLAIQYLAGRNPLVRGSHTFAYLREQVRSAHSEHGKALWSDPDFKAKMTDLRNQQFTPEVREKMSATRRRMFEENPEQREVVSQHFKEFYEDGANREAARDRLTRYREDPAVRAKINATLGTEEARKANSARTKKRIAEDPEYREKILAGLKAGRESEENRKRQSELIRQQRNDPEFQAKRLEALRLRREADKQRGSRVQLTCPTTGKRRRLFPDSPEWAELQAAGWR